MSTINFNVKVTEEVDGKPVTGGKFITPIVTVKDGKAETRISKAVVLEVGYICKAVIDGEPSAYGDKTKSYAGRLCKTAIDAQPDSASLNVYMPTLYADRDSVDLSKWTLCGSVSAKDAKQAAAALATCADLLDSFERAVTEATAKVRITGDYSRVTQPVYHAPEAGGSTRGKRSGGKVVTSLF